MKICVLYSAYDHSDSPLKDCDSPLDILPHLSGHEVEVAGIHKATAVRQVRKLADSGFDVFINLCDGAWDEDRAGIEVVDALERLRLPFTGAASEFYEPSREAMKRVCHFHGLATPAYRFARDAGGIAEAAANLRFPLIVKHPSSYSSIGMTKASRVTTGEDLHREAARFIGQFGEVLIEEFIEGREYTVLVVENADDPLNPVVFDALAYQFPPGETFKHYDLKWIDYNDVSAGRCDDDDLNDRLQAISSKFFLGLNGSGYGRCDIRVDARGVPYLLEINPNCGIFYAQDNAGSADLILLNHPQGYQKFLSLILKAAQRRVRQRTWEVKFGEKSRYGLHAIRDIAPGDLIEAFEEQPHVLVSRSHVEKTWGAFEKDWFSRHAYPLTEDVWVILSKRPEDWKPINHAGDPTARLDGLNVVARRHIARGEEITLAFPPTPLACEKAAFYTPRAHHANEADMEAHGQTTDKLKSYVERLERLQDEVDALKDSIKDLRTEIKNDGFNVKAVERIVAFRRKDGTADKEAEFINDVILYASVTGTPLDIAAPDEGAASS